MFGEERNLCNSNATPPIASSLSNTFWPSCMFFVGIITWQVTGSFAEKSSEMDLMTSMAIYSFLAAALFLFISIVIFVKTIISKSKVY
ncbi:hypothetical protein J7E37_02505 [Bacillus sp. ISL-39]|nr:hypothetical protein [Bacillus sp. ISL-39]